MRRGFAVSTFIAASVIVITGAFLIYSSQRSRHLHSGESVRIEDLVPLRFFGGDWSALSGVISDGMSGRGDLAVTTDESWRKVHFSGDVRFDSVFSGMPYGDAGFVFRVTQPDIGVDSFHGYYAGIRIQSQTLVFGKTEDLWSELREEPLSFPVTPGAWYRLSVDAEQCHFVIRARPASGSAAETTVTYDAPGCYAFGAIGLRLFYVQASWKDLIAES